MRAEIERLKEIAKEKGLSYEKIGQALGVSFQTVYRWFKGEIEPSPLAMEKIKDFIKKEAR